MREVGNFRIIFSCPLDGGDHVVTTVSRVSEGAAMISCPGCGQVHQLGHVDDQVRGNVHDVLESLQGQVDEMNEAGEALESGISNVLDRAREAKTYLEELRSLLGDE